MIVSFSCKETELLFQEEKSRRFHSITRVAIRKLIQMNHAVCLEDLAVPPGNRLEQLKGDWSGFYSIRINQQWRILFQWSSHGPTEVQIVDYH